MPPWLQVASTIVAAAFTIGTVVRSVSTWVWTNTIKRDLTRLGERIDELKRRVDGYDGSDIWGDVEKKVGGIEIEQRLLKQEVGFLSGQLSTLSNNVNAMRESRQRQNDYRKP